MLAGMRGGAFEAVALGQDEVTVEHNPEPRETYYKIAAEDCTITWTVYSSEANTEVVRHRSDCALPLSGQAPLIEKVLLKVLAAKDEGIQFRTLTWGRLYSDGSRDATMAIRLVQAAVHSPAWDTARGRPRKGDVNGFVRRLANDAVIYEELRRVFAGAGLELRLASVEKVLVLPAKQLPFFEALRNTGVRAHGRVPFDFQAWFSIRPIATNKP